MTGAVGYSLGGILTSVPNGTGAGASSESGLARPEWGGGASVPDRPLMRDKPTRGRAGMGVEQSGDGHEDE